MKHLVVCYDSSDDARRSALAKLLLDYGTRIQESVFECVIEAGLADQLLTRLDSTISVTEDDVVHVFELCGRCSGLVRTFGAATRAPRDRYIIL
jgi:CRISPR-associated protein Cas2